ncbi:MAG: hypothetical protein PHN75_06835 [Syntrophales bacterium]|nr:hypothetical protein [Syntrophales bacterium]
MKTSRTGNLRSIAGKIMMGMVLAAMIGSIDVVPAMGKGGGNEGMGHDNGRFEHRGRGYEHDRYVPGRRDHRPYGYRERVYVPPRPIYAPPPVIYAPPQPPGIGIFFPPIIIHP